MKKRDIKKALLELDNVPMPELFETDPKIIRPKRTVKSISLKNIPNFALFYKV